MTMDPIKRMAVHWYRAEYGYNQPGVEPSDMYTVAIPRVRAVLAGEVRWSEASPGDKAVWRGRPRGVDPNSDWVNLYDTATVHPTDKHRINGMFGNGNIGNLALTNLQVAGQACPDADFDVSQIYAELSRDLTTGDEILIEPNIGYHAAALVNLRELVFGYPIGRTIPVRQNFHVRLDWWKLSAPLTVVIHFEGTRVQRVANLATHTSAAGGGGVVKLLPPESHRWRARGRGGSVMSSWIPELDARRSAALVGGYVETWDEFVRTLYPLGVRCSLPAGHPGDHTPHVSY